MRPIERLGLTGVVTVALGLCVGGTAGLAIAHADGGGDAGSATSTTDTSTTDTSTRSARPPGRSGVTRRPALTAVGERADPAASVVVAPRTAPGHLDVEPEPEVAAVVDLPAAPPAAVPAASARPSAGLPDVQTRLNPAVAEQVTVGEQIPAVAPQPRQPTVAPAVDRTVAAPAVAATALTPLPFGLHDRGPALPIDSPMSWTMLAAASRETFAPGGTVAIPQTPLFTALGLQEVPILGPLLVTPLVSVVAAIPWVSDVLHPIVGYPLLPDGDVAPRDVRVVSFDGTEINVHLMPAAGLRDGQNAPTVLLAPALGIPGSTG